MRRLKVSIALLALVLVTAPVNMMFAQDASLDLPTSPYSLLLSSNGTTFCDFFDMVPTSGNALVYGVHNLSTNCGLINNNTIGAGGFYNKLDVCPTFCSGLTIGDPVDYALGAPIAQIYNFNFKAKTWSTWYYDGSNFVQFITGTFTVGPPGGIAGHNNTHLSTKVSTR
jgi:hypothetical protein